MKNLRLSVALLLLSVALLLLSGAALAQGPTKTTVTDTLYSPTGGKLSGTIYVTNPTQFTSPDGYPVPAFSRVPVTVSAGVFSVQLVPNVNATPSGTSYTVQYQVTGQQYTAVWVVPQSGTPVGLTAVQVSNPPTPSFGPPPQDSLVSGFKLLNGYSMATGLFSSVNISSSYLTDVATLARYTDASPTFTNFVTAPSFHGSLVGNAQTASAAVSSPSGCGAGQYATSQSATWNLTCAQVQYSQVGSTPQLAQTFNAGTHSFITAYNATTGLFTARQPDISDITGNVVNMFNGRTGAVVPTSGDYTAAQVTNAFDVTVANTVTNVTAPATPAVGKSALYVDATNKVLSSKSDVGTVSNTVVPRSVVSHQFLTAIAGNGLVSSGQPDVSDLTGNLVNSFNGRTGAVTPQNADYSYGQISGTPQLAQTKTQVSHQWLDSYSAVSGLFTQSQPAFSDVSGTVSTGQLPAAVPLTVVNDTNVTGSIGSSTLTLGWTGTLSKARQNATTVYTDQTNTWGAFVQQFQAGANFLLTDTADVTKKVQFALSGLSSGFTRVVTVPDANSETIRSSSAPAHQWATGVDSLSNVTYSQPAFSDVSGLVQDAQLSQAYSGVGNCVSQVVTGLARNNVPTCTSITLAYTAASTGSGSFVGATGPTITAAHVALAADPVSALDAATKQYVDNFASGVTWKPAVALSSAAALPTSAYNNGTSGVGATITAAGNGALSLDGVAVTAGQRVLIQNETQQLRNGIYTVTQTGDGSNPFILTRATDFNSSTSILTGSAVFVQQGSTLANLGFVMTTQGTVTVGTTPIAFTQFTGLGEVIAGAGLTKSGNTIFIATGGITNAMLLNPSTTVAGATCTLGSSCSTFPSDATFNGSVNVASGNSTTKQLIVGTLLTMFDGGNPTWGNNASDTTGTWKYITTGAASIVQQDNTGALNFYAAQSGTAGNAISWGSQRFVIGSDGGVQQRIANQVSWNTRFYNDSYGVSAAGVVGVDNSGEFEVGTIPSTNLLFLTNNIVRMTLSNSGQLGIGKTPSLATLDVNGGANFSDEIAITGNSTGPVAGRNALQMWFASNQGYIVSEQAGTAWRQLNIDGSPAVVINAVSSGNIGLQNSSPLENVSLGSNANFSMAGFGGFGQYQNYLTNSETIGGTGWTLANSETATQGATTAPDDNATATKLQNGGSANGAAFQIFTSSASAVTYTFSFWAKSGNSSTLTYGIQDNNTSLWVGGLQTITLTSTWTRYSVSGVAVAGHPLQAMLFADGNSSTTSGNYNYVWGAQIAAASTPLIYVRTVNTYGIPPSPGGTQTGAIVNGMLQVTGGSGAGARFIAPSGSANLILGSPTKNWTWYNNGNDLRLAEYTNVWENGGAADRVTIQAGGAAAFSSNVSVGGGSTIIYRCTVAGTLRVGQLTTVSSDCGAAVDTGLRTN